MLIKPSSFLLALATLCALSAQAVTVTTAYVQKGATEIRGQMGNYARPTVYVNQYACGERQLRAMACGPNTISVGTAFLQQQEGYGDYVTKFVLAHEWGHTIQYTRGINKRPPMQELQADCTAGTFAKYAETKLKYRPFIEGAVLSARNAADNSTHGTPSQRDYYARYGYAKGLSTCLSL